MTRTRTRATAIVFDAINEAAGIMSGSPASARLQAALGDRDDPLVDTSPATAIPAEFGPHAKVFKLSDLPPTGDAASIERMFR